MTDRDDHAGRPAGNEPQGEGDGATPGVIVVRHKTGSGSAKLLPPILILMVGTAFLAYRTVRSADWRGISSWFESDPGARHAAAAGANPIPPLARADVAPPVESPAAEPESKPETAVAAQEPAAKAESPEVTKKVAPPEALADIEREAEATREKIAELERLKEREARKLDETADERQRADRLDRRSNPRFGLAPVAPEQLEKMLRAQNEMLRRQMSLMAELQRRQFDGMSAMNRQFFNNTPWNNNNNGRGRAAVPPSPRPNPPRPDFEPGQDARNLNGRMRRIPLPDGGVARFREFQGPGGMSGFQIEVRTPVFSPDDGDDVPPPPPPPQLRGRRMD